MEKILYLIGFKFGKREVIGYNIRANYRLCKCECGYQSSINISSIKKGNAKGCVRCSADSKRFSVVGLKYGKLTVLSEYSVFNTKKERLMCECECGKIITVERNFRTKSCGCSRLIFTDRDRHSAIFTTWRCMKQRCTNTKHENYHYYGGVGVIIFDKWLNFINFYNDMKDTWFLGATIDRFPICNGNYTPENVRWATIVQQNQNKTTTRFSEKDVLEIRASYLTQSELAKKYNVGTGSINRIIKKKRWSNISA